MSPANGTPIGDFHFVNENDPTFVTAPHAAFPSNLVFAAVFDSATIDLECKGVCRCKPGVAVGTVPGRQASLPTDELPLDPGW